MVRSPQTSTPTSVLNNTPSSASFDATKGSLDVTKRDRKLFLSAVDIIFTLPDIAAILTAGQNAALFHSQRDPNRDPRYEPDQKPSTLHHFTAQPFLKIFSKYLNSPMICVNGTSSDDPKALPKDIKSFLDMVARRLVAVGVGHICGGAITGAMGAAIRAFKSAIENIGESIAKPPIVTILLKLFGAAAKREAPFDLGASGVSSVKQLSWQTRTPALHGLGRQPGMLFVQGGYGTLYEVFHPVSGRQFQNSGIVGVFNAQRPPSELCFVSSTGRPKHFFTGTESLLQTMAKTNACKAHLSHMHLFGPNEHELAIECLVEAYEKDRNQPRIELPPLDSKTKKFAALALEKLTCAGLAPRDSVSTVSRNFFAFMDNMIAAHILLYYLRQSVECFRRGDTEGANQVLNYAIQNASDMRDSTLTTLERLSHRPAVQFLGSAKDHLWTQQIEDYSKEVIDRAVKEGFSVVISGCGTEGMPKRWAELWAKAKHEYATTYGSESPSELVRVQASVTDQIEPARTFEHGYSETLLPTALTLDTRIELANCIGSMQALVLAPGGLAESLAWVQSALNRQLFGKMHTPYGEKPVFTILNVPVPLSDGKYYAGLQEQLEEMLACNTINRDEFAPEWFIDPLMPAFAAESLISKLRTT